MLKPALFVLAVTLPCVAQAADLPYHRHHQHHRAWHRAEPREAEQGPAIRCTTTDLGLITFANCGQSFDPFSVAAGR